MILKTKILPRFVIYPIALMFFSLYGINLGYAQNSDLGPGPAATKTYNVNIDINGHDGGLEYDGLGALSAGASSRLLFDYSEPERSQILDYLFKPDYGAAIQILKVEIGGDMNSTAGAEASHMRDPDEIDCNRGYEWWLMKEAKKRNPDIKLAGLQWGTPGWIGEFWSDKNIQYNLEWLKCAEQHDLKIDYMGGWNERRWDAEWYIAWNEALEEYNPDIQLIGADDVSHPWSIAEEMRKNPELRKAVDIIGDHSLCGWRTYYKACSSTSTAKSLDKPLWLGEHSTMGSNTGAEALARSTNRLYIQANVTGNIAWSLISAWYSNFPIADTGLMLAEWPWSGYYQLGKDIWVYAHTTQFTEPGWQYIDSASGIMKSEASFVTLKSPDKSNFSTVIETMDLDVEQTVTFSVSGGLPSDRVHLWSTDLRSDKSSDHFVHSGTVSPRDGEFHLMLQPGHVYTLSTTTGQTKGSDKPGATISKKMELPYNENFEEYGNGKLAKYFSDINGAFETAPCKNREGTCYRQVTTTEPVVWNGRGYMRPTTVMGDPNWWGDYKVSTDVMLEEPGHVELIGRVAVHRDTVVSGYHLKVDGDGKWKLYRRALQKEDVTIETGQTSFDTGKWHTISLNMRGYQIDAFINGEKVASIKDTFNIAGQMGLATSRWNYAQFDNIEITPTGSWPEFIPHSGMRATATTEEDPEHHLSYMYNQGYIFTADKAIDDRIETAWHSARTPNRVPLPQSITIDLGSTQSIRGLTYRPNFIKHSPGGIMTGYNIYISTNGESFKKISSGDWKSNRATKFVSWSEREARYVKLEGVAGTSDMVSAGEINIVRDYSAIPLKE